MRILILFFTLFLSLQLHAQLSDGLYARMRTNQGNIVIKLAFDKAPLTVINFVGLAEGTKRSNIQTGKPFYNGLIFHRVIKDFMIQGGDPKGNGRGGPGYKFIDEITDLKHDKGGILSMANSGKNTNGSQFFITHKATPHLDGIHTIFGHVVEGMDVVNRIKKDDFIRKIEIIRIGEKAKNFQTNEAAFQAQNKKYSAKRRDKFIKFIKDNYPNAQTNNEGYFVQINRVGSSIKPSKGDSITIRLSIKLDNGTIIHKADKPLTFNAGLSRVNGIDKVIGQSTLEMSVGEKRTIVTSYIQIFEGKIRKSILQNSLLIFNIELLSINK